MGAQGAAVAALQTALHLSPADGVFGPQTLGAVQAFQRAHGLPATGTVTPTTWSALIPAPAPAPGLGAYRNQVLRTGSTGPAVIALQQALHITPADGMFGPITAGAVVALQRAHHLTPSGVVDAPTWAALLPAPPSPLLPFRTHVLRMGSQGAAVVALQTALHLSPADGSFGPQTYGAVLALQRARHLVVSGVVDASVRTSLITHP